MAVSWLFAPHRRWESQASAFIDGELAAFAARRFQEHLAGCHGCHARVRELQQVKALISSLPEVPAPRSFAITAPMLATPTPLSSVADRPRWALRGAQVLSGAAIVAFFAILAIDLSSSSSSHTETASRDAGGSAAIAAAPQSSANIASGSPPEGQPTPARGIASPPGGGVGAQAVPSSEPGTSAAKRAESQPPVLGPTTAADAFSAPTDQSAAADGPVRTGDHQANDRHENVYRALEFSLLAFSLGAAVAAVVFARRLRRF